MRISTSISLILQVIAILAQCPPDEQCTDPRILAFESSECTDYHLFLARGSDSQMPGHLGELTRLVCSGINSSCGYENVIYPANSSFAGPDAWCESAATGATGGQKQLAEYADRCPDSNLIVLGFSQGGSVALDILGGGGGQIWECVQADNPALNRSTVPGSNIVAAAVFGPARRSAGQPYDVKGGEDFNGTMPRSEEQLAGLKQYASILRDYCNNGDYVCAKGSQPEALENHLNYFDLYNEEAAEWIVGTAKKSVEKPDGEAVGSNSTQKPTQNATGDASFLTINIFAVYLAATVCILIVYTEAISGSVY